jgi:Ran GTPase-activating protein (RanGAP) involved in mRNA processing and transport
MKLITMFQTARLQLHKAASPYPNLGVVPGELIAFLEASSLRDHEHIRVIIENVNYNLPTRSVLNISDCPIDSNAAKAIAGAVNGNLALTQVQLAGAQLSVADANLILQKLVTVKTLTSLDLSRNDFGDAGIVTLSDSIAKLNPLQTLKLSFNQIDENGAKALAEIIKNMPNLKKLELAEKSLSANAQEILRKAATEKAGFELVVVLPRPKNTQGISG